MDCARQWPVSLKKKVNGKSKVIGVKEIITCHSYKCQSRLPKEVKTQALKYLKVPDDENGFCDVT
jgi:hypothetical protein